MRGDLREVSDLGHVVISASGSAANWVLALIGFAMLRSTRPRNSTKSKEYDAFSSVSG